MRSIPLLALALAACAVPVVEAPEPEVSTHDLTAGRDLFLHSWVEDDAWSVDGNGLGPIFNARSCVACHMQGGLGGAGPRSRNVDPDLIDRHARLVDRSDVLAALTALSVDDTVSNVFGGGNARGGLRGLGTGLTLKSSMDLTFAGNIGGTAPHFRRNTPALFGAGLIDAIPDEVILAQATNLLPDPGVKGRAGLDEDGRVTRFGWKGEVASLREFVTQACALELGLTVPGRAELPGNDDQTSPGLDLDDEGVDALTAFVAALPAPAEQPGHAEGRELFDAVGCTSCHVPDMGPARGVYSDLLLHDMGPSLSDRGSFYGRRAPDQNASVWRTPPLWGVRDSGPWLHDGRAGTLVDAILTHDGEARGSRLAFGALNDKQRTKLVRFLESLVAPGLGEI
jgi:CxxC motif-containing protein (DUF1111 family)